MFKIFKTLSFVLFIMFLFPSTSIAIEYTSYNDLIENGKTLDGKQITIKGEAIGEPMKRGDFTWINISDGSNAMGIWIKNEEADKIKTFGSYKYMGDAIKVSGKFYRACSQHGGDMDIHGETLNIEEKGYKVDRELNNSKVMQALIFTIVTVFLFSLYYMKKIKKENKF